jgi:hypothetical protein
VQKGRLKVEEDDEQATLGQVLGGLLEAVDGEGLDEETWLVVCHCSTTLDGDVSWLVEFTVKTIAVVVTLMKGKSNAGLGVRQKSILKVSCSSQIIWY